MVSDEYKKLQESLRKKEDDDDYRNDNDPQGYELYTKCLENPMKKAFEVALNVVKHNPNAKEL